MKIYILNQQKDLKLRAYSAKAVVKEVLDLEGCETDELSLHFITDERMRNLHAEFFNDSTSTDCISFPVDENHDSPLGHHVLGEIFICPKTAIRYLGTEAQISTIYEETTLYLVHGLLHLLGYDDLESKARKKMKAAEERILTHLISKNTILC